MGADPLSEKPQFILSLPGETNCHVAPIVFVVDVEPLVSTYSQRTFQFAASGSKTYSPFEIESPAGPSAIASLTGIAKSPGCVVYENTSAVV